jgi:putative membrane protein
MRYVSAFLKASLFVVILSFALVNTDPVTVRYYLGMRWEAPLVAVLLLALAIGVLLGLLAALTQFVRLRRRIARLERELKAARRHDSPESLPVIPPLDML